MGISPSAYRGLNSLTGEAGCVEGISHSGKVRFSPNCNRGGMGIICAPSIELRLQNCSNKKLLQKRELKMQDEKDKEEAKLEIVELETNLESARGEHERERRELDELLRERDILNKKVVLAAGATQKQLDQVKIHENTRRNLEVEIGGYKGASALATTLKWCFIFEVCAASAAICTAFRAAPLRRLSETTHSARPFSTVGSSRIRDTKVANSPTHSTGVT